MDKITLKLTPKQEKDLNLNICRIKIGLANLHKTFTNEEKFGKSKL